MNTIKHLRELLGKSTPGPLAWKTEGNSICVFDGSGPLAEHVPIILMHANRGYREHDAALIVAMRNNLEVLLDVVEAASEIQRVRYLSDHQPALAEDRLDKALAKLDEVKL